MSNKPPIPHRYYPRLSSVVSEKDIPDILGFIRTGIINLLDKIYFKDLQYNKSPKGDAAFYSLSIVSKRIDIEIPGTGIFLVLNPDFQGNDNNISAFPITIEYQWKILAYLRFFSVGNFSFDPQQIFEVALRVLNITEEQAIAHFVNTFEYPEDQDISSLQQFVKHINEAELLDSPLTLPTDATTLQDLVAEMFNKSGGKYASLIAFSAYLSTADLEETSANVKVYFRSLIPQDIDAFIKDVIIPKFRATLLLSAGIEFPRNLLVPVYPEGTEIGENDFSLESIPENTANYPNKVMLRFGEALFYADTEKGFGYNMDLVLDLNCPAGIGKTGLVININNLKIDLSTTDNIAEADADGRPKEFMGVYMEYTEIFLPKKWFKKQDGQTIGISANNLLVGTGGISGSIAVRATYKAAIFEGKTKVVDYFQDYFTLFYPVRVQGRETTITKHSELVAFMNEDLPSPSMLKFEFPLKIKMKGTNEETEFKTEREYILFLKNLTPISQGNEPMWFSLGDKDKEEVKKWRIGFYKFDIDFYQGQVVHSSLHAALEIKKFKKLDEHGQPIEGPLRLDLLGEWESSENFKLTASFLPMGWSMKLFDGIILTLQTAELGREGKDFFIGADTKLTFPKDDSAVGKIFKGLTIDLPAIRIYSNGRFEISGGRGFIPSNFTLPLGPIDMSVSGIHLGSTQREFGGKMRNYNYIGFDGALNVDPIGLDIMGNGIKYYYTVDDDDFGNMGDRFLHITTLEIDLIIPGNASEEQAIAIIKGSLTIPVPGDSSEFGGSVSVKIPRAHIAGEAYMKLNPKNKSFLVSAALEFPGTPIPLGPIGIYGFKGLIGKKYVADKKAVPGLTESSSWYDYYVAPQKGINEKKFREPSQTDDYSNPFSVGIGASIATMGDGGRAASLRAMMLLSMPSMFAIDAGLAILSERLGLIESDNRIPPFYAFLIIGDNSLEFGAGANYKVPTSSGWFMETQGEMQAGFFFKNQRPWYINFGTKEKPITATLFKNLININAQSYLMISAAGIEAGARVGFDFDLIIARAWVIVEVGAHISFERPQVGGYMYIEGGLKLNFYVVQVTVAVSIFFSVEIVKPFLIFAQLRIELRIRIFWFLKIRINMTLTLKWGDNGSIDNRAIPPLTYLDSDDSEVDYIKKKNIDNFVKGIHMLTNESFDLKYIKAIASDVGTLPKNPAIPSEDELVNAKAVFPLDTFIDIKFEKGVSPSFEVDKIIGSHTSGAQNFIEMIPPRGVVKGNLTLRQVKHQYSIDEIKIKIAIDNHWEDYNPYDALSMRGRNENSGLWLGHWQKNSDQYDSIRLLGTSPFSYLDVGEPGWMIPEQYGINASTLFCTSEEEKWYYSNFLNIPLGTEYAPPAGYNAYLICNAYYNIDGTYAQTIEIDENGDTTQVVSEDTMRVVNTSNPFGFSQSLEFSNGNNIIVTFPEISAKIKLKLSTYSTGVMIECYEKIVSESITPQYDFFKKLHFTKAELASEIELAFTDSITSGFDKPRFISKIKISPDATDKDRINEIIEEIASIWNEASQNMPAGATSVPLTRFQRYRLDQLNTELVRLKSAACADTSCKNLIFGKLDDYFDVEYQGMPIYLINDEITFRNTLNEIQYSNVLNVDFNNFSVLILEVSVRFDNYVINKYDLEKIIDKGYELCLNISPHNVAGTRVLSTENELSAGNIPPPLQYNYSIFKIEKVNNKPVIKTFEDCGCTDIPCTREDVLCDYFDHIMETLKNCVNTELSFVRNIDCFNNFFSMINDFDLQYPQYVIGDSYEYDVIWEYDLNNPPTVAQAMQEAHEIVEMIKREKGNCGCGSYTVCTTSLQQVSWMTMEEFEYQQTIPGFEVINQQTQDMIKAMNKTVQPIWRPDATYLLHFRLKDDVDNGSNNSKVFDYYYSFMTKGPIGHYHKQFPEYLEENVNGELIIRKEEEKTITSLRPYIDYERSYPNPDGNLLGSKPLFYGNMQCKIDLFFTKGYISHMFSNWRDYLALGELQMDMPIVIKDPVSEVIVPYPLPQDWHEENVPEASYSWEDESYDLESFPDSIPDNLPTSIKMYLQMLKAALNGAVGCKINPGELIPPTVKMRTVTLTDLKPEKLYTAMVFSAYDLNKDNILQDVISLEGTIISQDLQKVHEFGFRTSRFKNFREQVTSYRLSELDNVGNVISTKQAVYGVVMDFTDDIVNNLYALVSNQPNAATNALRDQYMHEFDRAIEGVLMMKPLDVPRTTDFVKIVNNANNNVVAILIRNPEPFNDPRIPLVDMVDALEVITSKSARAVYDLLWSKDYSQVLIMSNKKRLTVDSLRFKFIYKTWDGNQKKYVVTKEDALNEDEKLNTVRTEIINFNNK